VNVMKRKGNYNKTIDLDYRFIEDELDDKILAEAFDLIFKKIIQDRKRLLGYFRSEDFIKLQAKLLKRRSILLDYLAIH